MKMIFAVVHKEDNEFEKQSKGGRSVSKFDFKRKYLIIYLCLIIFDAFLMLCRWLEHIVPNVRLLPSILRKVRG